MTYDGRGMRFGTVAEEYDLYRPAPPDVVATVLGDLRGRDVLEVGAGTGKWTRLLLELGAVVTVVEPDDEMRAVLVRQSPEVHTLKGAAEALPLGDASFDAILVPSAWHWFEQPAATTRDGACAARPRLALRPVERIQPQHRVVDAARRTARPSRRRRETSSGLGRRPGTSRETSTSSRKWNSTGRGAARR